MNNQNMNNNIEPNINKPKEGRGKTVVLIIFFIFLFAFVIGLPYIKDYVDNNINKKEGLSPIELRARQIEKEQQKQEQLKKQPKPKEELKELTCTTTVNQEGVYTKTVEEVFTYNSNKQVIKSSKEEHYIFTVLNDLYTNIVNICNQSLELIDKEGFEISCLNNDPDITVGYTYELDTFKPFQASFGFIDSNSKYKDNIDKVKTNLETLGYICN